MLKTKGNKKKNKRKKNTKEWRKDIQSHAKKNESRGSGLIKRSNSGLLHLIRFMCISWGAGMQIIDNNFIGDWSELTANVANVLQWSLDNSNSVVHFKKVVVRKYDYMVVAESWEENDGTLMSDYKKTSRGTDVLQEVSKPDYVLFRLPDLVITRSFLVIMRSGSEPIDHP